MPTSSTTPGRATATSSSGACTRNTVSLPPTVYSLQYKPSFLPAHTNKSPPGPIVRFGPNSLSFNSAPALKSIYSHRANVRKAQFYDAFVHPAPNTHNARDRDLHARKRRVLAQAFSDSAIKEMERYVLANVRTFCEAIGREGEEGDGMPFGTVAEKKGWSGVKNMSDWCNYLAMDILGDLCFGKAFRMLESPDNRFALDLVVVAAKRHLIVSPPLTP